MQAVRLGLERRSTEREAVAQLLGGLCPQPLTPAQLTAGLALVLQAIKVRAVLPAGRVCLWTPLTAQSAVGGEEIGELQCSDQDAGPVAHSKRGTSSGLGAVSRVATLLPSYVSQGTHSWTASCLLQPTSPRRTQDTSLDCPDATACVAMLLARLAVDKVLPATFLGELLPSLTDGSLGVAVVQSAGGPSAIAFEYHHRYCCSC